MLASTSSTQFESEFESDGNPHFDSIRSDFALGPGGLGLAVAVLELLA
jgi:hypothetical protein